MPPYRPPTPPFTPIDAVAYVDTLALLVQRRLPNRLLSWLRRNYGRQLTFEPSVITPEGIVTRPKIVIHQPTAETLEVLRAMRPAPFVVHRVDIAVDFLFQTGEEARLAQAYLDRHVIQKWRRRNHEHRVVITTSYWKRERAAARNIALYSDRPSKVSLGPCSHLEMRFKGARACRAVGLSNLADLAAGVDVQALLKRQAKLAFIDPKSFDRQVEQLARHEVRRSQDGRTVVEVKAAMLDDLARELRGEVGKLDENAIALIRSQQLFDSYPDLRGCLRDIAWEEFSPSPSWSWPGPR